MRQILVVALLGSALFANAANADVTFTDNMFNSGDYGSGFTYLGDNTVTAQYSQCATCGFGGGNALSLDVTIPLAVIQNNAAFTGQNLVWAGVLNDTFSYDPGVQGAISSIDASVEKNLTVDIAQSFGNSFRVLIQQDSNFYVLNVGQPLGSSIIATPGGATTGYGMLAGTGFTAADFQEIDLLTGLLDPSENPDFSGDAMLFGIVQPFGDPDNVNAISTDGHITASYDNLSITLKGANPPAGVPEPATLALFGAGLAGAAALRKRGKRKA